MPPLHWILCGPYCVSAWALDVMFHIAYIDDYTCELRIRRWDDWGRPWRGHFETCKEFAQAYARHLYAGLQPAKGNL